MKPRKPNETDENYIKRLEAALSELRKTNKAQAKWLSDINRSVTALAVDGSVAFQAMAEKARVRSHPSVTAVVEFFSSLSHPQWPQEIGRFEFPEDWEFDPPNAWAGDADMELNAATAEAFEYFEHRRFKAGSDKEREGIARIAGKLQKALTGLVNQVKDAAGFVPKQVTIPAGEHYKDLSREQLIDLVSAMGWMALDIAQDMAFANEMLRRDLRAATYRRVCADLYALAWLQPGPEPTNFDVKVMGGEAIPF